MSVPNLIGIDVLQVDNWVDPVLVLAPAGIVADSILVAFGFLHNLATNDSTETRLVPQEGWTYLGGTVRQVPQFGDPGISPDFFWTTTWVRVIPAASAGAEPTTYTFNPVSFANSGDFDRPPNGQPFGPFGGGVMIMRYELGDLLDPVHNFSLTTSPTLGVPSDPTATFANTIPPVAGIDDTRLIRFTAIDVLASFTPPAGMNERGDVNNAGVNPFNRVSVTALDKPITTDGILPAQTVTWGAAAHWADHYVLLRPGTAPDDILGDWDLLDDFNVDDCQAIASKFDNYLYVITTDGAGIDGNSRARKLDRSTGEVVLDVNLNTNQGFLPLPMDVNADALYLTDANLSQSIIHKYSLSFDSLALSSPYTTFLQDLVCGSGVSAGKLWALTEVNVRRYAMDTLAFLDEVPAATWSPNSPPDPAYQTMQGALDAAGNLWVLSQGGTGLNSRLSFISGTTLAVTHYDITDTFPGTAANLTFYQPTNSLYIATSLLTVPPEGRGFVAKWSIATHDFTHTFTSEKKVGTMYGGFKYGPSQCILPVALPAAGPFVLFCLPPQRDTSEVLLLHTSDLTLVKRFPTTTETLTGPDLGIFDAIFDSVQAPDFIWGTFWNETDATFRIGHLDTQETIMGDGCGDIIIPPTKPKPPKPPHPPGAFDMGLNCVPLGLTLNTTDIRYVFLRRD